MKIEFQTFRPCVVCTMYKKQKGFCHGIFQHSDLYMTKPVAIVEVEGGNVIRVNPTSVKFLDSKFDEYDFGEDIEDGVSEEDKLKILESFSRGEK